MEAERQVRAFALFDELVEMPTPARERRLAQDCADDPALRVQVERLLAADGAAGAADDAGDDPLGHWARLLVPLTEQGGDAMPATEQLGEWRLLSPLGRGGMGVVYLAERVGEGFCQRAALKLMGVGLDTATARMRFLRERRILAQLRHPNIAPLLDGGVTEAGLPYFAMAYVEGECIDQWCDRRGLGVRARVKLFLQVLDAVQYAHRNLVVHRDLKPSNVMVDEDGHVSLLDFGIARLIDDAMPSEALTRDLALTPQYAAPEQLQGKPATTASDIYQVGLMLHGLLVSGHPLALRPGLSVGEWLKAWDQPPRSLVQGAREATGEALAARGSTRQALVRQVRGDLAAIVGGCIAQEPEHRYASADALAQDLRRWLEGRTVLVRVSSRGYRLRKFARRYRWGLLAIAGIICALAVGMGVALQQAREARMQAQRAEQVKDLVISVFVEQDPLSRKTDESRSPAQVVADGIHALDPEAVSDPQLRGELLDDLGEIQGNLGDVDGARKTLEEALVLRTRQHGANSPQVAKTERKLATLLLENDHDAADRRAQRVLDIEAGNGTPHSVEAARARLVQGMSRIGGKQREQALALTAVAVADLTAALGADAPETVLAVRRHAQMLTQLRRDEAAIDELRGLVATLERARGADSAQLVAPLIALGGVLALNQRYYAEADAAYARATALSQRYFTGRNKLLAATLSRYGGLKVRMGDYAQAQALFTQAEAAMPVEATVELAQLLTSRGRMHLEAKDDPAAAERDLQRGFDLSRQSLGEGDGITWFRASQWGRALARLGRLREAERVQRDALAQLHRTMGEDAYQNVLLLEALAETLLAEGRNAEAAMALRRALALTATTYGKEHALYKEGERQLQEAEQQAAPM